MQAENWLPVAADLPPVAPAPPTPPAPLIDLERLWNDFQSAHRGLPPDQDTDLAALLAQAIEACSHELTTGHWFSPEVHDWMVHVETHGPNNSVELAVVGICNKGAEAAAWGVRSKR